MTDFPKTLEAARKDSACQWDIGLALIEECGPPGKDGARTGSDAKLKEAQKVLAQNGFEYSFEHLRDLRATAHAFAAGERSSAKDPDLPWSVHLAAGNPDTLRQVKREAKRQGKSLTVAYVRKLKAQQKAKDKDRDKDKPKPGKGVAMATLNNIFAEIKEKSAHADEYLGEHLGELTSKDRDKLADMAEHEAKALADFAITLRAVDEEEAGHDTKAHGRQRRVHAGKAQAEAPAGL